METRMATAKSDRQGRGGGRNNLIVERMVHNSQHAKELQVIAAETDPKALVLVSTTFENG